MHCCRAPFFSYSFEIQKSKDKKKGPQPKEFEIK
jgi:hypothetical protein